MYFCPATFNAKESYENARDYIPKFFKIKQITLIDKANKCLELAL